MKRTTGAGFTLIELLIVIVIIGVIAAIAYPSYRESVIRSDRSDAKVALQRAAQAFERCYAQYHSYKDSNCPSFPQTTPNGYYSVTATVATVTFAITATPVSGGPQSDDSDCTSFTLDSTGAQGATGSSSSECW
ncbi:MAG TPA: type IV pilin protein [Gammaproteobacteria bacterium]|nr:type IV pilin protein [Gammaproteobacteria bacterium]